jgi:hypothetical protein
MHKIKKTTKLTLDKQSLRNLTIHELPQIRGATGDLCLLTPSCRFVCTKAM